MVVGEGVALCREVDGKHELLARGDAAALAQGVAGHRAACPIDVAAAIDLEGACAGLGEEVLVARGRRTVGVVGVALARRRVRCGVGDHVEAHLAGVRVGAVGVGRGGTRAVHQVAVAVHEVDVHHVGDGLGCKDMDEHRGPVARDGAGERGRDGLAVVGVGLVAQLVALGDNRRRVLGREGRVRGPGEVARGELDEGAVALLLVLQDLVLGIRVGGPDGIEGHGMASAARPGDLVGHGSRRGLVDRGAFGDRAVRVDRGRPAAEGVAGVVHVGRGGQVGDGIRVVDVGGVDRALAALPVGLEVVVGLGAARGVHLEVEGGLLQCLEVHVQREPGARHDGRAHRGIFGVRVLWHPAVAVARGRLGRHGGARLGRALVGLEERLVGCGDVIAVVAALDVVVVDGVAHRDGVEDHPQREDRAARHVAELVEHIARHRTTEQGLHGRAGVVARRGRDAALVRDQRVAREALERDGALGVG